MEINKELIGLDVRVRKLSGDRVGCTYMLGKHWKDEYDFESLRQIVSRFAHTILPSNYFFSTFYNDDGKGAKGLIFSIENFEKEIDKNDFNQFLAKTDLLVKKSHDILINGSELVSFEFTIPKELKIPFKQYLQYFPQFMNDQGQSTQIMVEDINSSTWVTIIPSDEKYPPDILKAGLINYIGLIKIPRENFPAARNDIAFTQLLANINHLQNQIILLTNQLEDKQKQVSNTESLFTEAIQVKEFDGKYLKIDLPSILRSLKRRFK